MESVVPEKESGPDTFAEVTAPVPLPVSIPPKVVEPVPPLTTVSAWAKVSAPFEAKDEVAVAPKLAVLAVSVPAKRVVEVAEVALMVVAVSPPLKVSKVEVAFEGNGYPIVLVMTPVDEL